MNPASQIARGSDLARIFHSSTRPRLNRSAAVPSRSGNEAPVSLNYHVALLRILTRCGWGKLRYGNTVAGHQQPLKVALAVLALGAICLLPAQAGTITGTVRAQGKAGADAGAAVGKYDSRQFKFVERVNYNEMRDFIVYIEGKVGTNSTAPEKPAQIVTSRVSQKGAMFSPHVLPVMVGTTVEWPNNDDILHNVFSASQPNDFDLGLYKNPEIGRWTFKTPGRVDVFCSIHTRMSCIVLVLKNPYFAVTNERGVYSIAGVPPGTYELKAWHERLPSQVKEITVSEQGDVKVDFTLGITNLPKP
jgi:plastocyanin